MKAILILFDSLNKRFLEPYGGREALTPNFTRLANKSVRFDNMYVGSMPCMPARRELHTGRYNFLHRGWGGLEPYDISMPELLGNSGIRTHISTDHYHYIEDGGHHYLQRYNTCEIFRGQEGDAWKSQLASPDLPDVLSGRDWNQLTVQDQVNRGFIQAEEDWPMHKTVSSGIDFLDRNGQEDNWFLTIETFDPHEPFVAPQRFRDLYEVDDNEVRSDWPPYGRVDCFGITPPQIENMRREYCSLVTFCDYQLGRIMDKLDELDLWNETLIIVGTDHGFFLGEKECLGKSIIPYYNEVANTPLFIRDPRSPLENESRGGLTQTIDIPATILRYFNLTPPPAVQGKDISPLLRDGTEIRKNGLCGNHGGHVNLVTSSGHVYMRGPDKQQRLSSWSLDFTRMRGFVDSEALQNLEISPPRSFTEGMPLLKFTSNSWESPAGIDPQTMLFDLNNDPDQLNPLEDNDLEESMISELRQLMQDTDVPDEVYRRFGMEPQGS